MACNVLKDINVYYLKNYFMRSAYFVFTLIPFVAILSCKKPKQEIPLTDIAYKAVNRTVKASDPKALGVDINEDGLVDYSFFAQYVVSSSIVHLYIGVSPISNNSTKMGEPEDKHYLNMGSASAISSGSKIDNNVIPSRQWSNDFAYLAIRHELPDETKTYEGTWGDGSSQILPLRLDVKGTIHYGWARMSFNKTTEQLTFIEYAWNRNPGQELTAGQK